YPMNNVNLRIKKPTTPQEQVEIFRSRGLIIENEERAIDILSRINYYRLSAYTLTFKQNDKFLNGVTFEGVYQLYEFDRKLRSLLMANLEWIEITFRTQLASYHAHTYGAIGYLFTENFVYPNYHEEMIRQLEMEIDRSKEVFVYHHKNKYHGVFPIWV